MARQQLGHLERQIRGAVAEIELHCRGKVVIDNDQYLGSKGHGQYLKRGMNQYLI